MPNMAAFRPMPMARTITEAAVNTGVRRRWRNENWMSFSIPFMNLP